MAWHKDVFAGNPVIYAGDGKHSATFHGPEADGMRTLCFASPDMQEALRELLYAVDERCGGKCEGTSRLAIAADKARAAISKAWGL